MPKIMIVDDDAAIQEALKGYLAHMDYSVAGTTDSGAGAVEMAREVKPDLILMDIVLPGEMDGISAAQEIKAESDIPIVFITGYGDRECVEKAQEIKPFGYVMKPFGQEEIGAVIEIALHKKAMELKLKKANEQLAQTNRDLKQEIKERKLTEEALRASEEQYRSLVESTEDAIFLVDRGGAYLFMNGKHLSRIGCQADKVIGKTYGDFHLTENSKEFVGEIEEVFETGETTQHEHKSHRDNKYFLRTLSPIKSSEGHTTSVTVVSKEISERKQAEEALQESEEKYRTILETIEDGYYEIDLGGNFTFFNDSMCKISGYSRDELMGMNNRQYTDEVYAKEIYQTFNKVYTTGKPNQSFHWPIIRKDGIKRTVAASVSLRRDAEGEPMGFRGIVRDISERKKFEAQLQQFNKMEAIATLAGGVAHEFNNALMGVMGNIELFEMDLPEDARRTKYFESMKSAGHRMSSLTDQLLAYAEGGKYQPKDLKMDDFVIETLPILHHALSPTVRVETHFAKDISYINADNAQMQMILSAILSNSNEAIEDKGLIRITAENKDVDDDFANKHAGLKRGPYVCLTVEDDGRGMDEETRDGIFEPFFTTKFQGRGMGMAAVHGIVRNHDGWISVDSKLGKGTTAQIYLPAIEIEVEKPKKTKAEATTGTGTILMIEDEDVVIEVTQAMLERLGYRVMVAKTGKDAIHIAETFHGQIDLALLDIKLPDIDGRNLYPLIMKARSNLKVIVCSGYSLMAPPEKSWMRVLRILSKNRFQFQLYRRS